MLGGIAFFNTTIYKYLYHDIKLIGLKPRPTQKNRFKLVTGEDK